LREEIDFLKLCDFTLLNGLVLSADFITPNANVIFSVMLGVERSGRDIFYEGESKIIRNVATCCAVGYTAGWT
jgi:hypothetical protein